MTDSSSNPWGAEDAFDPMMGETVGLTGKRPNGATLSTSFAVCVFPVEDVEPLAESDIDSDVRRVSILVPPSAIRDRASRPLVGDVLTQQDGTRWTVSRVIDEAGFLRIEAKGDPHAH